MTERQPYSVTITDVTLREFGQNVANDHLDIFSPEIRCEIALSLMDAGFKNIEIFSCVSPKVAPSMNQNDLKNIAKVLGRNEGVNLITLVPNIAGFTNFLNLNLGPDGYNHTMGIFFSAIESHNILNLGRSIKETIDEYKTIAKEALSKDIRMTGYISAAFGYIDPKSHALIKADLDELTSHIDMLFDFGLETVTLSDLQGVADKKETQEILEAIINKKKGYDLNQLGYHPHHISDNQALSNSLTAYDMGIRRFDASLGGTGGCVTGAPGNQPTELLVQTFDKSGIDTGIDEEKVSWLAKHIQKELYSKITAFNENF